MPNGDNRKTVELRRVGGMTRTPKDELCINPEHSDLYNKLIRNREETHLPIEQVTNTEEVIEELERLLNWVDRLRDMDYRRYWR